MHEAETARFYAQVVRGPEPDDCWIFKGPIGGDGYGRFWIRRGGGKRIMLRSNRYALAVSLKGVPLEPWVFGLHGCDNPICVRVSTADERGIKHLTPGTQRENMERMGRMGRGEAAGRSNAAGRACWNGGNDRWRCARRCATAGTRMRCVQR